MRPINQFEFYQLGAALNALKTLTDDTKLRDAHSILWEAKRRLMAVLADDIVKLGSSRQDAGNLLSEVESIIRIHFYKDGQFKDDIDWDTTIVGLFLFEIHDLVLTFEHVLAAEMRECAVYYVPQVGMYNTADLVDRADLHIPSELLGAVNEAARAEFRQAGRCLAFDLPTAAAFHALRAAESVLDDYYRMVAGPAYKEQKTWNDYVVALEKIFDKGAAPIPSKRIIRSIRHIKDLDRNPVMHPRWSLSTAEALTLFNIAMTAISEMAVEMKDNAGQGRLALMPATSSAE